MKIFKKNNIIRLVIDILLLTTILSIPLYQFRLPIFSSSLSILTIFLFFLCISLFFYTKNFIFIYIKNQYIFTILTTLFIISFVPNLLFYQTMHGIGVFIEWVLFPAITGFLLCIYLQKNYYSHKIILAGFTIILAFVSIVSLLFFFNGNLTYDNRLSAFFLSPNHLAMFLAPLIFIAAAFFLKEKNLPKRLTIGSSIIIGIIVIILTQSLNIAIATCLTAFIGIFILAKKNIYFYLFSFLIFLTLLTIGHQKILNSNKIFERNSISSRIMIWETSIFYIQKSALTGYPIDDFQNMYLEAQPLFDPYLEWAVPTPHNIIFTLWISGGFFAMFVFCILSSYVLFDGFSLYYKQKKQFTVLYCTAFIVILLSGIIDTIYWKNDLSIIFWIIISIILSPHPKQVKE